MKITGLKVVTFGEIMLRLSPPDTSGCCSRPPWWPHSAARRTSRSRSRSSASTAGMSRDCRTTRSATRRFALRAEGIAVAIAAAAIAWASTSPRAAPASADPWSSTIGHGLRSATWSPARRLVLGSLRSRLAARDRHHAALGAKAAACTREAVTAARAAGA